MTECVKVKGSGLVCVKHGVTLLLLSGPLRGSL